MMLLYLKDKKHCLLQLYVHDTQIDEKDQNQFSWVACGTIANDQNIIKQYIHAVDVVDCDNESFIGHCWHE